MRMWMVDPKLMCLKHLMGEHVECHMFVGCIRKGLKISGSKYVTTGLVEVHNLKTRHDDLAREMTSRSYQHKSPLPEINLWTEGCIDSSANLIEIETSVSGMRKTSKRIRNHLRSYHAIRLDISMDSVNRTLARRLYISDP